MPSEDSSHIEDLKKSLYSRNAPDVRTRRKLRFSETENTVKSDWEHPQPPAPVEELNTHYEDHSMSFFTKLLIGSMVFCVAAVGIGAFLFFNGTNLISADNIDITINGPVSVPGGEVVPFEIQITNKNNIALQGADMSIDFPGGSTKPEAPSEELKNVREFIGDLAPGGKVKKSASAIMFGEENLQKQIVVSISYKVKGSTSLFTKKKTYEVLINSSPVNLTVSAFREITAGQEFDTVVHIKSNSQQALKNVLLKAEYPFGYTFISASPKSLSDNLTWKIGDIPAGSERVVTIHGKLQGEDNEERVLHFLVGAQSSANSNKIGTPYMDVSQHITLQKPFISLGLSVNGDQTAEDAVAGFGDVQRIQVNWFNNLAVPVTNAKLMVKLSGSAYDKASVQPEVGYYRSATDEIEWNQQTTPDLASIAAGASGSVYFSVTPRDLGVGTNHVINPTVSVTANVSGDRPQEANVPSKLTATAGRTIRVASNIALSGRIVRTTGPFANTGPIPPKVDQATTYTIIWTADNTSSSISGAQVVAALPAYVTWLKMVSPSTEDVTYDQNKGLITWNIGTVGTYTTAGSKRREVAFQVSFQPSAAQVGQLPTIINQAVLTATDTFTQTQLKSEQDLLTTRFSTDPGYRDGDENIVR